MTTEAVEGAGDHLSIGEVLDELQREFPDVTISKIRFLESQGLIDPERTPSGYRRFYTPDLERLRWILLQQRDHFLPLRVIKERLDAFGPTGAPRIGSANGGGQAKAPTPAPSSVDTPKPTPPPTPHAPAVPEKPSTPSVEPSHAPASAPATASSAPPAPRPTPTPPPAATPAPPPATTPRPAPPAARPSRPAPPPPSKAEPPRPVLAEISEEADVEDDEERFGPVRPARDAPASTDLTRVELLEATGLTDAQLDALESFGILGSVDGDDGRPRFDDENLAIAELAAGWYRRGVEARHLKMYSHFAEREAALFTQVLIPYVRQRNPDSKAKLQGELEELTRLGRRLRTAMLRRALRDTLTE
jgi:DNA-binding transcriptional MerR regulator